MISGGKKELRKKIKRVPATDNRKRRLRRRKHRGEINQETVEKVM